jgi:hypothetical protein
VCTRGMETVLTLDSTVRQCGEATISARMQVGTFVFVLCNAQWEKYRQTGRSHLEVFQGYASASESAELHRLMGGLK